MFDIAWTEIGLIGIVALIVIGPKDLPVAIKAVTQMVKKARKMAGEFQTHVDEMVREADLHEVRDTFNDLRRMDIKGKILSAVDRDGTIGKSLAAPVTDFSPTPPPVPVADTAHEAALDTAQQPGPLPDATIDPPALPEVSIASHSQPATPAPAPAFVPPRYAPQAERPAPVPPAFIPPAFAPPAVAQATVPQIEAA